MEDSLDRALRNACFAVDALFRMDVEDRFTFVEAFDRANNDTVGVFAVEAWFGDDVCHQYPFQSRLRGFLSHLGSDAFGCKVTKKPESQKAAEEILKKTA